MARGYFVCAHHSPPGALHPPLSSVFPTGSAEPPASPLPTYKELSTNQAFHFLHTKSFPPVFTFCLRQSSLPRPPLLHMTALGLCPKNGLVWPKVSSLATLLVWWLGRGGRGGEAEVRHDKTCLPELPKVSLFCFLVCGTLTRSGRSIWQWVTNSRLPRESAAQPGRAQECWWLGLAVTTRSCFPRGCPSKAPTGEYSAEISPVMRISYCNSWQNWIAADLWGSVPIFSNSSFETPLPPSVLPFASISHFYLMGCFCVCFVSCKFQ